MAGTLQPGQQLVRVADGRGQPDPLQRAPAEPGEPFEDGEQVPAAVVAGEGVDLVDHHGAQIAEELPVLDLRADEHRLERLRRGEQDVRPLAQDALPRGGGDVPVPHGDGAPEPCRVRRRGAGRGC